MGQAGVRLWRFEPNVGPFIGIHATGGTFNIGNRKAHYKGYLAGAGVSYGYSWLLTNRWNLTAEVGIGCYYISDTRRDYFTPWTQDELIRHNRRIALGPSKAEVSFSYLF